MIDPNKIETITILKDKYAITQYGEKGKEGVVSITYTSGSMWPNGDMEFCFPVIGIRISIV